MLRLFRKSALAKNIAAAIPGQSGVFVKPNSFSVVDTVNFSGSISTANLGNAIDSSIDTSGLIDTSGYSRQTVRYAFSQPVPAGSKLRIKAGWLNGINAGVNLYVYNSLALSGKKLLLLGSSTSPGVVIAAIFTFTLTEPLAVLDFASYGPGLPERTQFNIFNIEVEL